ncbi:MAG: UDP-N-acetylglucosamine 4,6-dehydratase (inverting) [Planctomycetota bacterium]
MFDGKRVLVTGGTGSFGKHFVARLLRQSKVRTVIVFSRDELKQSELQALYPNEPRMRYFIGDVRDADRLRRAFDGVDLVVHAAAMKQIPAAEYNPFEAVKTNIIGAQNVIDAAIDKGVKRVVALSTDKASSPVNLYGATKLVSDKLFVAGNAYAGARDTKFAVVRYGNVMGSRGSVIPYFKKLAAAGKLPITDERMTRFWITLDQAVDLVLTAFGEMHGGEIFVPKIPSMRLVELAHAIVPEAELEVIGVRPGEKLHEEMISSTDARRTVDVGDHYVVLPEIAWHGQTECDGAAMPEGFSYSSDTNQEWLSAEDFHSLLGG